MDKPVDRITSGDVLACLAPIWKSKPGAAAKARSRIAAVFRWCVGRNLRPDNPVDRAVAALPRANGSATKHYRALPHAEVRGRSGRSAGGRKRIRRPRCGWNSSRSPPFGPGEARRARWQEIDFESARWTWGDYLG